MKNYNETASILDRVSAIQTEAQEVVEEIVEPVDVVDEKLVEKKISTKDQLAEAKAEIETLNALVAELTQANDALQAKLDLPKEVVVEKPRWISITDNLPEENQLVLVYGKGTDGVKTSYYATNKPLWKDGTIAYWMHLPEAPEAAI